MKIFVIKDDMFEEELGYLFYYENSKTFYVELPSDADEWKTPLLLNSYARRKKYTVDADDSLLWVQQRIVPSDRQNLGMILRDNHLKEYDEFKLLMLANGRCEQDSCYLVEIEEDELPEEIKGRKKKRIKDAIVLPNQQFFISFQDNTTAIGRLTEYAKRMEMAVENIKPEHILVQPGGFYLAIGQRYQILAADLYDDLEKLPFSAEEFEVLAEKMLVSTTQMKDMLNCSRQNIDDLVKRDKLHPVDIQAKTKLFRKSEVQEWSWK